MFVGLDMGGSDELDVVGIGHQGLADHGGDDVVQYPGVGGGFDDEGIGGFEVLLCPLWEAVDGDAPQGQDDLQVGKPTPIVKTTTWAK